jgi:hypothetical protein
VSSHHSQQQQRHLIEKAAGRRALRRPQDHIHQSPVTNHQPAVFCGMCVWWWCWWRPRGAVAAGACAVALIGADYIPYTDALLTYGPPASAWRLLFDATATRTTLRAR